MSKLNGNDLIGWGFEAGAWFKDALTVANTMRQAGRTNEDIRTRMRELEPQAITPVSSQDPSLVPIHYNIEANTDYEVKNLAAVRAHVEEIASVPTVRGIAVMPDACPSSHQLGTVPVGGVIVAQNAIHPSMHSYDVCCSVAISLFDADTNPTALLDAGMKLSHFGMGGRSPSDSHSRDFAVPQAVLDALPGNKFLHGMENIAQKYMGTQGDGNHFYYVGRLESTGQIALVTHHGSRKFGADVYTKGMECAKKHMKSINQTGVKDYNAWIPFDTDDGRQYWDALQIVRLWTKANHFTIHDLVSRTLGAKVKDRFWNEHNFVFKRNDYFVHAKGSTPNYAGFSPDADGRTLIPLSMADPILVCSTSDRTDYGIGLDSPGLGFCPHGAGRNMSRKGFNDYLAENSISPKQVIADVRDRFDVRAFSGKYDISEFPGAYKNGDQITSEIKRYALTVIADRVMPIGSIMAGHVSQPRRDAKKKKKQAQAAAAVERAYDSSMDGAD